MIWEPKFNFLTPPGSQAVATERAGAEGGGARERELPSPESLQITFHPAYWAADSVIIALPESMSDGMG